MQHNLRNGIREGKVVSDTGLFAADSKAGKGVATVGPGLGVSE